MARHQLRELGFGPRAIEHRLSKGRLHPITRGVYAVGRPHLSVHGHWMAAVLSCGPEALLSHHSAAVLWQVRPMVGGEIEVSVPSGRRPRRRGIVVHRRAPQETARHHGIPVTTPVCTLVDIALQLSTSELEAAINEADKRDLVDPESLRGALDRLPPRAGVGCLRRVLDRRTFALTDSALERRFLSIVRRVGLPTPRTGCWVNGHKVDFYWPDLGLVVETDGLRYHRTPAQQGKDRLRDQTHAAAGLTHLRFTHSQVRYEPEHVAETLHAVTRRLLRTPDSWQTPPVRI